MLIEVKGWNIYGRHMENMQILLLFSQQIFSKTWSLEFDNSSKTRPFSSQEAPASWEKF
jgi:hypothetical protein